MNGDATRDAMLDEVSERLHSCAIRLLRRARAADREAGVGPAQLSALSVLYFSGPLALTRLAEIEQVAQPTMSRVAGALVAAGLVSRGSGSDGRVQLVEITPAGRALFEAARARRLVIIRGILAGVEPGVVAALGGALEALSKVV
jgi:DNA-binding MarR family transcriptional regulator